MASHAARRWWQRTPKTAPVQDAVTDPTPTVNVGDPAIRAFENRHHKAREKQPQPFVMQRHPEPSAVPVRRSSLAPVPTCPPPPMPGKAS